MSKSDFCFLTAKELGSISLKLFVGGKRKMSIIKNKM